MHKRFIYGASLVAFLIILVMLNFTTPTAIGPLGVLLFFTTVYVVLFGVSTVIFSLAGRIMGRRKLRGKDYLYVAVVAFAPVILLLMQGFGGITVWTVILTAVVVAVSCFLVAKKA